MLHFHLDYLPFPLFSRQSVPWLSTLHGRLDLPELGPVFDAFPTAPVVSISNHQRGPLPQANWAATVLHGLPRDLLTPQPEIAPEYLAFLGRICPEKRPDRAIRIAALAGMKIRIAAKVDRVDEDYFAREIEPLLASPDVEFIGEISDREKPAFLSGAKALLLPIDWPEPFGLVMIEAMACGTPVIAYPAGSVPEVVEHGLTGFIVRDEAEAAAAAHRLRRTAARREYAGGSRNASPRVAWPRITSRSTVLCQRKRSGLCCARCSGAPPSPARGADHRTSAVVPRVPAGQLTGRPMPSAPATFPWPAPRDWLLSLAIYGAAVLALLVAFRFNLSSPYWAASTVYIVAQQPSLGALRAKAMWRFVGTFVGAAFSVLAVSHLVNAPPLLVVALSAWIGVCLVLSLRDPTPRGYAFMLAGYTASIIGFPSVGEPGAVFDTAVSRVEEIGLGIVCAHLVLGVLFPSPGTPLLLVRLDQWLRDAATFAADTLGRSGQGRGPENLATDRRRVARDGALLDAQFQLARYEPEGKFALSWLPQVRAAARRVPALLTALADREKRLRQADPEAADALRPLLLELAEWMRQPAHPLSQSQAKRLRDRFEAAARNKSPGWAGTPARRSAHPFAGTAGHLDRSAGARSQPARGDLARPTRWRAVTHPGAHRSFVAGDVRPGHRTGDRARLRFLDRDRLGGGRRGSGDGGSSRPRSSPASTTRFRRSANSCPAPCWRW